MVKRNSRSKAAKRFRNLRGLELLHEDDDIIIIDKEAGILTIATPNERTRTAYFMLNEHVRRGNSRSRERVYIVHRLDRETSGLLVFARSLDVQQWFRDHWPETRKTYLAVVHGAPERDEGSILDPLVQMGANLVRVARRPGEGRECRTDYRVISRGRDCSLLEIGLVTGHKHQIRVHLKHIGHGVVGDRKYRTPGPRPKRMMLHAHKLAFLHPHTGAPLEFESPVPQIFSKQVKP